MNRKNSEDTALGKTNYEKSEYEAGNNSPVRQSPTGIATLDAPRLACVKPIASVHPEPGSNSPLLKLFFILSRSES